MSQISKCLRSVNGGFAHWCPACEEMHLLPSNWTFDGNIESPTFSPSFKHSGKQTVKVDGKWTGEWVRDANGNCLEWVCHYNLIAGQLHFCPDCTHSMAGKTVPLPLLPEWLTDEV